MLQVRRNDLLLYAERGDAGGPAMTWSMFAINWLDLGDLNKAADNFHRAYSLYRRTPFNVSMAADNLHRAYSLYRRTPFNVSMAADSNSFVDFFFPFCSVSVWMQFIIELCTARGALFLCEVRALPKRHY